MNDIRKKVYIIWRNIIDRCNNANYPTYINCAVDEEWTDFNAFYQWYKENFYQVADEKMCVDKDILVKGNSVYSPHTCCIIPETINMILTNRKRFRGDLPVGVTHKDGKYMAKCKIDNKDRYIGYYDSADEAFLAYKKVKEEYIREVANRYKDVIPQKVYNALLAYQVDAND